MTTNATVSSHHGLHEPQTKGQSTPVNLHNNASPAVPYYTPKQDPPAGTGLDANPPKLFTPIKLRDITFPNRIFLSPLCQYSAENGHLTDWHLTHLGGIIQRGPGLAMVEATSITPEGRITPEDSGLWQDSQIAPLKRIVDFAHSQDQKIGIQLGHAGRKASTVAPWLSSGDIAHEDVNGWPNDVVGASAIRWNEQHAMPKELTVEEIRKLQDAFGASVRRAVAAGFDAIEIHSAHGYLLHSFLSPVCNKRTDQYGGSFENRTRLTREITEVARANMPKGMPLLLRISGTDFLEESDLESWRIEDTAKLAPILADLGVDLLDVSGGGNHPAQKVHMKPGYQSHLASHVKSALGDKLLVGTVGTITEGKQANRLLDEGLDVVFCGRAFQKNPGLVFKFADDLETDARMPNQIQWGFRGRGSKHSKK